MAGFIAAFVSLNSRLKDLLGDVTRVKKKKKKVYRGAWQGVEVAKVSRCISEPAWVRARSLSHSLSLSLHPPLSLSLSHTHTHTRRRVTCQRQRGCVRCVVPAGATQWTTRVSFPPIWGGDVTKFARHKALKSIGKRPIDS